MWFVCLYLISLLTFGYTVFFLNGLINNIPYLWLISERWTWRSQSFILHFFLDSLTLKKIWVLQNSRLIVKGMCNETNFVINITLWSSSSGAWNQAWWYIFKSDGDKPINNWGKVSELLFISRACTKVPYFCVILYAIFILQLVLGVAAWLITHMIWYGCHSRWRQWCDSIKVQ